MNNGWRTGVIFLRASRRACLALRAGLALALTRLKNAKNNTCSAGYYNYQTRLRFSFLKFCNPSEVYW